jgi:hypothetical protein
MALAAAGQVYLWTKTAGPPPPSGDTALRFDYRFYGIVPWLLLFLKGVK